MLNDKIKVYPCTFVENNKLAGYKKVTKTIMFSNNTNIAISLSKDPFNETSSWILMTYKEYSDLPFEDQVENILGN